MPPGIQAIESPSHDCERPRNTPTFARLSRFASTIFVILAVILLLLGLALTPRAGTVLGTPQGLLLDASTKSFGAAPARTEFPVMFTITNTSRQQLVIIGANFVCGPQGCLSAENLPLEIPPREQRDLTVHVKTVNPGDFQREITLYTDCPGKSEIVLTVNGRVTQEKGKRETV